jgi:hypothetical protein
MIATDSLNDRVLLALKASAQHGSPIVRVDYLMKVALRHLHELPTFNQLIENVLADGTLLSNSTIGSDASVCVVRSSASTGIGCGCGGPRWCASPRARRPPGEPSCSGSSGRFAALGLRDEKTPRSPPPVLVVIKRASPTATSRVVPDRKIGRWSADDRETPGRGALQPEAYTRAAGRGHELVARALQPRH